MKVGIGDPHRVVFHLPGESSRVHVFGQLNCDTSSGKIFQNEPGISEELLKSVLRLLRKYLMDDSVDIIDMTSQVLRVSFCILLILLIYLLFLLQVLDVFFQITKPHLHKYISFYDASYKSCFHSKETQIVRTLDHHSQGI